MIKLTGVAAGMLVSFAVTAETMTNPGNGEVWVITDNGAYNADNAELIKYGDKYYGSDGRIYLRQDSLLMQVSGPRQEQTVQPQTIQIRINTPPAISVPWFVPVQPNFHRFRSRKLRNPDKKR